VAANPEPRPRLIATVSIDEPEPRWIRRLLGHRFRRRVIFTGYVHGFDLDISGTGIVNSTVVVRDPTDALAQVLQQQRIYK